MMKLLRLWLAWRAIRLITATALIVSLLALVTDGHPRAAGHNATAITRLRHAIRPLEQQLERTIESAFKP